MAARIVAVVAALLWLGGALGLDLVAREVPSRPVRIAPGLAGVLYTPPASSAREGALPSAVLIHGFSGNAGSMGALARVLARSGVAALALDMPGHGRSDPRVTQEPRRAAELALDWILEREDLAADSVVIVGHASGALAALEQAQWDPARAAALILLALPADPGPGAYLPPSTLIVWGDRDAPASRAAGRALGARLAGHHELVGGRVYGDAGGAVVRVDELHAAGRWSVLGDTRVASLVVDWVRRALGAERVGEAEGDTRGIWGLAALTGALALLWALCGLLASLTPRATPPPPASPRRLLASAAGLIVASGAVLAAGPDPGRGALAAVPLAGARAPIAWITVFGVMTLVGLRSLRAPLAAGQAGAIRAIVVGAGIAAIAYLTVGTALRAWIDPFPGPGRLFPWALVALLSLPGLAALELGLRDVSPLRAWLAPLVRLSTLAALIALALTGRAGFDFEPLRPLLISAPLLELVGWRCAARGADPLAAAVAQAILVAWPLAALFPLEV